MQEMLPIVSVIVPIYKVEKYLRQCIESIRKQTYSQLEIILVEDGSPDYCGSICDKSAAEDSRIIVIHKRHGGVSSARNAGIDIASGKYLSFIDADDTVHPKFIEIMLGLCEKYDCDIAQCDFLTVAEDSLKLPINPLSHMVFLDNRQALHELCSGRNNIMYTVVWNKIYKRHLFDSIRYPLGRIHEDEYIVHSLLWNASRIAVINQYLYYYLQRPNSITGEKLTVDHLDVLGAFKERLRFLEEKGFKQDYLSTLHNYIKLIEKYYIFVKENVREGEKICIQLLREKERYKNKILPVMSVEKKQVIDYKQIEKDCSRFSNLNIVLYGAGNWGCIYYQWVNNHSNSKIVGWVDNFWNIIDYPEYHIKPIDSILCLTYDYILIAIMDKKIQKEVTENLISWGISQSKILSIFENIDKG